MKAIPSKQDLQAAVDTVKPIVHRTAVLQSRMLNDISGADIYFKCENFQRMGAFKMRGAVNAIAQLTQAERAKGVVTHSSGNFAQAVSLAAAELGVPAYIVMPSSAPEVKKTAVLGYGGQVFISEPTLEAREAMASKIQTETGATFLHPSNDIPVILGQGTAAVELLEDHPDLEVLITPVGGGGLLAGTALAGHYFGSYCKVFAGEPMNVDDAYRSLRSGKIETNESTNTVADGLRTQLGDNNFPIIQELVTDIIRVEEEEIIAAMRLIWERMKIIIEPSCAVPFAAVLKEPQLFAGKKIGIVLSGGNVDLGNLPF
ncbi:pyridoxal-phosphate dependent enzyme [Gilvibacter sediminis]|uniref:pyridoxal-phosphate dependent enzyme n=1 Tax=Gilvibacter sediminis TaxID=379071 RepID=UPI00234FD431|nr:pyridoxal-phosphate dependent enzyme [Gilvibacter sediminis]MDC7998686.1 pyridoxal-phosphate dependent enzyme [Gilvibacter sediminis]